ncbi:chlorophyllase, partial [Micromonospora sp. M51]|nr:chlorophyllase [Micromonospora sp. M51]
MSRRVTPALLASALLLAGLVGCSADARKAESQQAPVEPPPAATPTPQVPAGKAPQRAFAVGVRQLKLNRDGRALPTTLWYPAAGQSGGAAKRSATAAEGRFPVVMFSHGLGGRP